MLLLQDLKIWLQPWKEVFFLYFFFCYILFDSISSSLFLQKKIFFFTKKKVRRLPETFKFLLSYFIFSDGIGTVATASTILAVQDLGMSSSIVVLAYLGLFKKMVEKKKFGSNDKPNTRFDCLPYQKFDLKKKLWYWHFLEVYFIWNFAPIQKLLIFSHQKFVWL